MAKGERSAQFSGGVLTCNNCGATTPVPPDGPEATYAWVEGHKHLAEPKRVKASAPKRQKSQPRRVTRRCWQCDRTVLVLRNGRFREHKRTGSQEPCPRSGRFA